jgi:Dihydrodipicolinate synthase/N-acetylneuraminate lyase
MDRKKFYGSTVALVTPFSAKGEGLNEKAYKDLVEWQIKEGTNGIVPCGTTGESPTFFKAPTKGLPSVICEPM